MIIWAERYRFWIAGALLLLLIFGGIVAVNRLTNERKQVGVAAEEVVRLQEETMRLQRETHRLQEQNKDLISELDGVYRTRTASCELNNHRWTAVHQFLRAAIRARDREGDSDIADDYEAIDRLIWPVIPCSVSIPPPLR